MNQPLKIYEDDKYVIALSRDNWKAAVVQVCAYGIQKKIKEGQIVEDRSVNLAWEGRVDTVKYDQTKKIVPVDANDFRKAFIALVQEAKNQLGQLQHVDNMVAGVFKDYESQLQNGKAGTT